MVGLFRNYNRGWTRQIGRFYLLDLHALVFLLLWLIHMLIVMQSVSSFNFLPCSRVISQPRIIRPTWKKTFASKLYQGNSIPSKFSSISRKRSLTFDLSMTHHQCWKPPTRNRLRGHHRFQQSFDLELVFLWSQGLFKSWRTKVQLDSVQSHRNPHSPILQSESSAK